MKFFRRSADKTSDSGLRNNSDFKKRVTLSISGVSSPALQALLDSAFEPASTSGTNQTNSASAPNLNTESSADSSTSTSGSASDSLTQDVVSLLKALATGDVSGAKSDLAKLKSDLDAQSGSSPSTNSVTKDLTSLLKDLASGNTSAAKADVTSLATDVKAQEASAPSGSASGSQTQSPLDTLVAKLTSSLNSGSIGSALQDVASYLIQNGQGSGSLVNTTA